MHIRDNVRRRRRERIVQLLGQRPAEDGAAEPAGAAGPSFRANAPADELHPNRLFPSVPERADREQDAAPDAAPDPDPDPDPEKWWKEQQKRRNRTGPAWRGAGGLNPASSPPPAIPRSYVSRLAAGFAVRLAAAAVLFGAAWVWFHSDLPGSREARTWTIDAVTKDMDFQAAEVWYEQTFGGYPSFLPTFRSKGETQAVFGGWKRSEAVRPAEGRMVQTFAQDGSGIRIAATGGSIVKAVYAGRVLQVATEDGGKATVLVQHAGRIVTIYGNVEQPAVKPNDWVEAGQRLGIIPAPLDKGGESLLYFAVKQNGKTVDPAEVVPFD
jgi:stage IV sporulation protein FA